MGCAWGLNRAVTNRWQGRIANRERRAPGLLPTPGSASLGPRWPIAGNYLEAVARVGTGAAKAGSAALDASARLSGPFGTACHPATGAGRPNHHGERGLRYG